MTQLCASSPPVTPVGDDAAELCRDHSLLMSDFMELFSHVGFIADLTKTDRIS